MLLPTEYRIPLQWLQKRFSFRWLYIDESVILIIQSHFYSFLNLSKSYTLDLYYTFPVLLEEALFEMSGWRTQSQLIHLELLFNLSGKLRPKSQSQQWRRWEGGHARISRSATMCVSRGRDWCLRWPEWLERLWLKIYLWASRLAAENWGEFMCVCVCVCVFVCVCVCVHIHCNMWMRAQARLMHHVNIPLCLTLASLQRTHTHTHTHNHKHHPLDLLLG